MASLFASISATTNSLTINLAGRQSVSLKNDGTADVYYVLFNTLEEPRAATTADSLLKSTDSPITYNSKLGYKAISVITASSTATLRCFVD